MSAAGPEVDYDAAPPMPVADYRRTQDVIPGVTGLYRMLRAIFDANVAAGARILVSGAGGGREMEALGASPRNYRLVGLDPSGDMLDVSRTYIEEGGFGDRVTLRKGVVAELDPDERFDGATSILVMHFLPDDGAKLAYLREIRSRLNVGAPYLHADASFDDRRMFERLAPVIREHALIVGLPEKVAEAPAAYVSRTAFGRHKLILSESRTLALFREAGFRPVAPFFRGLWFAGWWAEAA